jgi:hypothetical protein
MLGRNRTAIWNLWVVFVILWRETCDGQWLLLLLEPNNTKGSETVIFYCAKKVAIAKTICQ